MKSLEASFAEHYAASVKGKSSEAVLLGIAKKLLAGGGSFEKFVAEYEKLREEGAPSLTTSGWFSVVDKVPTPERLTTQVGVHLEECGELLTEFSTGDEELDTKLLLARSLLEEIGTVLKSGRANVKILNRKAFFDAVLDQRVTGEGVAYLAGFNLKEGVARVDVANFTKFVDGKPIYKEGGKIAKGPNFWNPEF